MFWVSSKLSYTFCSLPHGAHEVYFHESLRDAEDPKYLLLLYLLHVFVKQVILFRGNMLSSTASICLSLP